MLGGFSRWYIRKVPPDFGCCAMATVEADAAIATTAKRRSLVISSLRFCLRFGSPNRPALIS
jgi:hypothetical protein